jgi:hypothetical protein
MENFLIVAAGERKFCSTEISAEMEIPFSAFEKTFFLRTASGRVTRFDIPAEVALFATLALVQSCPIGV